MQSAATKLMGLYDRTHPHVAAYSILDAKIPISEKELSMWLSCTWLRPGYAVRHVVCWLLPVCKLGLGHTVCILAKTACYMHIAC